MVADCPDDNVWWRRQGAVIVRCNGANARVYVVEFRRKATCSTGGCLAAQGLSPTILDAVCKLNNKATCHSKTATIYMELQRCLGSSPSITRYVQPHSHVSSTRAPHTHALRAQAWAHPLMITIVVFLCWNLIGCTVCVVQQ
jgi:hypothetical protein